MSGTLMVLIVYKDDDPKAKPKEPIVFTREVQSFQIQCINSPIIVEQNWGQDKLIIPHEGSLDIDWRVKP